MTAYLDTSALLPYYRQEACSAQVERFLQQQKQAVLISRLTAIEFASALARWVRTRELDEPQANRVESAFFEDLAAGRFRLAEVTTEHFARAQHWLLARKTALRTLDALHLALSEAYDATLVTLDQPLLQAAYWFGVRARTPD